MIVIRIRYPRKGNKIDFDRLDGIEDDIVNVLVDDCGIQTKDISVSYKDSEYETIYVGKDFDTSVLNKISLNDDEKIVTN